MFTTELKINFKKMIALVFLVITSIFLNISHAADCTQKLLPTSPVIWMGEFENFRYTEEHQYGELIALWRSDACVFGYFISMASLQGNPPKGLIENVVYEPKTGKLSFKTRLNLNIFFEPNEYITTTDWFTVKGILTKRSFRGIVQDDGSKKTVHLKKSNDSYYDEHQYKNYGEWQLEFKK